MLTNEVIKGNIVYSLPKQFIKEVRSIGVVSEVSGILTEQINEDFRRKCAIYDIEDAEARVLASQVIVG